MRNLSKSFRNTDNSLQTMALRPSPNLSVTNLKVLFYSSSYVHITLLKLYDWLRIHLSVSGCKPTNILLILSYELPVFCDFCKKYVLRGEISSHTPTDFEFLILDLVITLCDKKRDRFVLCQVYLVKKNAMVSIISISMHISCVT